MVVLLYMVCGLVRQQQHLSSTLTLAFSLTLYVQRLAQVKEAWRQASSVIAVVGSESG